MRIKHIVVTRFAIKWRFNETKLKWKDWLDNSVQLMDTFCRPSLKNQTNQDFTLLSLVDDSVSDYGNVLNNEVIIKLNVTDNSYPKPKIIEGVNKYIESLEDYDAVILTRLDRDDCLHYKFLEKVKRYLISGIEQYVDLNHSLTYDYNKKITHDSKKYYNTFVSPFVSTCELINNNNKIKCISLLVDHNDVPKYLKGEKINDLFAMQVIHGKNLVNRIYGEPIKINKKEYGIK